MNAISVDQSRQIFGAPRLLAKSAVAFIAVVLCSCGRQSEKQNGVSAPAQDAPALPPIPAPERSTPTVESNTQPTVPSLSRSNTDELIKRATLTPTSIIGWQERIEAVKQLGDKRIYQSVPVLIANLTRITPFTVNNFLDYQETYPASEALAKIGVRAVPQITKRFEETTSEPERLILLDTLVRIKGKNWVFNYLAQVDKQHTSTASKERLGTLQAWVETR